MQKHTRGKCRAKTEAGKTDKDKENGPALVTILGS